MTLFHSEIAAVGTLEELGVNCLQEREGQFDIEEFRVMTKTRWWFEGSDRSYSAIEEIVNFLEERLEELVADVEDEGSMLGAIPPYIFALVSLGESSGGTIKTSLDPAALAEKVMLAHDAHVKRYPGKSPSEIEDERSLLVSLFDRLAAMVD